MKSFKVITYIMFLAMAVSTVSLTGCFSKYNLRALCGVNISDLEKARENGVEKVIPLPYNETFDKILSVLHKKNLTVYQKDRNKKFIVAIGLPKQTNTTRIGIFFDILSDTKTKVTLSSLSTTALDKADVMIFNELREDTTVID